MTAQLDDLAVHAVEEVEDRVPAVGQLARVARVDARALDGGQMAQDVGSGGQKIGRGPKVGMLW